MSLSSARGAVDSPCLVLAARLLVLSSRLSAPFYSGAWKLRASGGMPVNARAQISVRPGPGRPRVLDRDPGHSVIAVVVRPSTDRIVCSIAERSKPPIIPKLQLLSESGKSERGLRPSALRAPAPIIACPSIEAISPGVDRGSEVIGDDPVNEIRLARGLPHYECWGIRTVAVDEKTHHLA